MSKNMTSEELLKMYTEPAGTWKKEIHPEETWTRIRFVCPICGKWNTYGQSEHCPHCGVMLNEEKE